MILSAYFAESGLPRLSLSPSITVYDLTDGSTSVASQPMTEVGTGWYSYDFTMGDTTKDYAYVCDSVVLVGSERYAMGEWSPSGSLDSIVEAGITTKGVLRGLLAVFMAKRQGMGTNNSKFRDQTDSKNRLDATLDNDGNITSITLDLDD